MRRIALLVATVVGVASLFLFFRYQNDFEKRVSGGSFIPILVVSSPVALGDVLTEETLAVREIPESYVEDRHIRAADAGRIIGIRATMGLKANEAILWTDLAVSGEEGRVLSGLVRSGMRAVTITTSGGGSLGGLLRPGDRIDLLFSVRREEKMVVLPLLQNVLVLAVGREMGAEPSIISMVRGASDLTVSVTTEQAQALTLAQSEGSLSASLRNPGDIVVNQDRLATTFNDILTPEKRKQLQSRRTDREAVAPRREIEHVR